MANDANKIVVGSNGTCYAAPTTATAPTTVTGALAAQFYELGFLTEDGATIHDEPEITDILTWQSFYPVRRLVASREFTLAFSLREWRAKNVILGFGGGTVAPDGSGGYKYTPPDPSTIYSRSFVLDWADGTKNYRLYIPAAIVTEAVESQVIRTDSMVLPITVGVTPASSSANAYQFFTNDPAWADYTL